MQTLLCPAAWARLHEIEWDTQTEIFQRSTQEMLIGVTSCNIDVERKMFNCVLDEMLLCIWNRIWFVSQFQLQLKTNLLARWSPTKREVGKVHSYHLINLQFQMLHHRRQVDCIQEKVLFMVSNWLPWNELDPCIGWIGHLLIEVTEKV